MTLLRGRFHPLLRRPPTSLNMGSAGSLALSYKDELSCSIHDGQHLYPGSERFGSDLELALAAEWYTSPELGHTYQ